MPEVQSTVLDYLTAIGAIATPILVLLLTGIGWKIRHNLEHRSSLEEKLRDDRIHAYNEILEPFIILLMSEAAWSSNPKNKGKDKNQLALQTMLSLEYRRHAFKMALVGGDNVVSAYNDLNQYSFSMGEGAEEGETPKRDPKELIALLGAFLLEVRKSMGNEDTALDKWSMLEWFLSDARKMRA